MRGFLFPLFWWFMFYYIVKIWVTKIGEIGIFYGFGILPKKNIEKIPILPIFLRVKYQNHERIPILLAYVLTG